LALRPASPISTPWSQLRGKPGRKTPGAASRRRHRKMKESESVIGTARLVGCPSTRRLYIRELADPPWRTRIYPESRMCSGLGDMPQFRRDCERRMARRKLRKESSRISASVYGVRAYGHPSELLSSKPLRIRGNETIKLKTNFALGYGNDNIPNRIIEHP
jgi:hypothetical protein